jgi:DNA modification methylase
VLIHGDARDLPLADESVQCVVTSPPYWGLRDYGLQPSVWDGEPRCAHVWSQRKAPSLPNANGTRSDKQSSNVGSYGHYGPDVAGADCAHCPAWRGVLGLEPQPELYVQHLVQCFREVRRVLRADGTVWLNLGDSYASGGTGRRDTAGDYAERRATQYGSGRGNGNGPREYQQRDTPDGLKPKDLVGIPWRVAFALQQDGWYLRADVIWAKPNPMPESVTDRPTKAHEYLFLLAKGERYFYDAEAVRERASQPEGEAVLTGQIKRGVLQDLSTSTLGTNNGASHRNRRSVWAIATEPYPEAHFATFPEALVAPCILAGTSEAGACRACGAPWARVVERRDGAPIFRPLAITQSRACPDPARERTHRNLGGRYQAWLDANPALTGGWRPTCACRTDTPRPCLVLDPFAGTATVGAVAERLGRAWVGVDLKPEYLALARKRTAQRGLRFTEWRPAVAANGNGHGQMRQIELVARL